MDTHIEFCIHFWEATRELDLYSMDGSQLDRIIVDALLKTNGGKELLKTSVNELSVLIRAINYNNRKIQQHSLPDNLDEAAEEFSDGEWDGLHDNDGNALYTEDMIQYAYKAGAEWMAKQGFISEGIIYQTPGEDTKIELNEHIGYLEDCEKVIVNIRKK